MIDYKDYKSNGIANRDAAFQRLKESMDAENWSYKEGSRTFTGYGNEKSAATVWRDD